MPRTVKDPDVRREELMDIAEDLFSRNGYEDTTISDIVGEAGIAQGTFYHHFRSKEELLEAIADRFVEELSETLEELVDRDDMPATGKLFQLLVHIGESSRSREGIVLHLHDDRNVLLHIKLERRIYRTWVPLIRSIVVQGTQEGSFDTRYPEEAAITLLAITGAISHGEDWDVHRPRGRRAVAAFFDLLERIVGATPGTFNEMMEGMVSR